jgi:hypothetical protein
MTKYNEEKKGSNSKKEGLNSSQMAAENDEEGHGVSARRR